MLHSDFRKRNVIYKNSSHVFLYLDFLNKYNKIKRKKNKCFYSICLILFFGILFWAHSVAAFSCCGSLIYGINNMENVWEIFVNYQNNRMCRFFLFSFFFYILTLFNFVLNMCLIFCSSNIVQFLYLNQKKNNKVILVTENKKK